MTVASVELDHQADYHLVSSGGWRPIEETVVLRLVARKRDPLAPIEWRQSARSIATHQAHYLFGQSAAPRFVWIDMGHPKLTEEGLLT